MSLGLSRENTKIGYLESHKVYFLIFYVTVGAIKKYSWKSFKQKLEKYLKNNLFYSIYLYPVYLKIL